MIKQDGAVASKFCPDCERLFETIGRPLSEIARRGRCSSSSIVKLSTRDLRMRVNARYLQV